MDSIKIAAVMVVLCQLATAELKIPRSVYTLENLEVAKGKAFEEGKPLIFVLTDPGTT